MITSVKNKIRAGTLFLFLLVLLSGGFSIYYIVKVKQQSENVLKANYNSLQYCLRMQEALDSVQDDAPAYADSFRQHLEMQLANITEPEEQAATQNLKIHFANLQSDFKDTLTTDSVRADLNKIFQINLAAIEWKNNASEQSASEAMTILIAIVGFIFIVGFTFSLNFPSILTSPIQKMANAIRQIGERNYAHRIHLDNRDEFGDLANAFNEMAERLEYFTNSDLNKLIFEKSRAEAVINSLKDASIGIDKNHGVLFANTQALQLLGLRAEDTLGKSTEEISKRNDLFRFLVENDSNTPFKIVVDGKENYYVREVMEVSQGESTNKVIVLKNITSFKELDVAKTDFISTISHELKTPLASSDFSIKLLMDERVGKEEQKELLQQLRNDNQRMLRILSELLNMSQVEAGKIQLDIRPVSAAQIVLNSVDAVSTSAKEKHLHIDANIPDQLPDIKADPEKLGWVVNNFLTNAIKFAPANSAVRVEVQQSNGQISFSVNDKGQGIDSAYLERIFERYFQVPGRSDRKGSGIGLAICKEFIEAMNGKVWVYSVVGEGSTFGFDLPIVPEI